MRKVFDVRRLAENKQGWPAIQNQSVECLQRKKQVDEFIKKHVKYKALVKCTNKIIIIHSLSYQIKQCVDEAR